MKKLILSAALMMAATFLLGQAKVEIGLKGGVNASSLSGNNVGDNITAYHGGAYGLIKITKIGIQPEVLFSKRGSDQIDLSYMDVPVMLKLYLAGGLNLQAGPQFGIVMNKDAEDPSGSKINSYIEDSDISAVVGAGLDLPMGLNVTARYILGLKDVNNYPGIDSKGNTFQFSLGYRLFKIGN